VNRGSQGREVSRGGSWPDLSHEYNKVTGWTNSSEEEKFHTECSSTVPDLYIYIYPRTDLCSLLLRHLLVDKVAHKSCVTIHLYLLLRRDLKSGNTVCLVLTFKAPNPCVTVSSKTLEQGILIPCPYNAKQQHGLKSCDTVPLNTELQRPCLAVNWIWGRVPLEAWAQPKISTKFDQQFIYFEH
jgi:hypothetical protein